MLHPFAEDTSDLTIAQLTDKISDLSQKYFRTNNPQVQQVAQQIVQQQIVKQVAQQVAQQQVAQQERRQEQQHQQQ